MSTWQAAEELAADWLRYFGHADARLTGAGPDGGIDVTAAGALVQVKFKAVQVGAPDLQRLFGARGSDWDRQLFFFSGTSYSAKALAYAEVNDIALFTYTLTGEVRPVGTAASTVMAAAERVPAPGSAQPGPTEGRVAGPGARPASAGGARVSQQRLVASDAALERDLSPLGRCLIGSGILFLGATLAVVGLAALTADAVHTGMAGFVTILGLAAWAVAAVLIATGTSSPRRQARGWGAAAVVACWAPGVALWTGLAVTFYRDDDHPASAWVFAVVAAMTLPGVATAARRWRQR